MAWRTAGQIKSSVAEIVNRRDFAAIYKRGQHSFWTIARLAVPSVRVETGAFAQELVNRSQCRLRPFVGRVTRQMIGDLEPGNLTICPEMHSGLDCLGAVEGGNADVDQLGVVRRSPGEGSAAAPAKMPQRLGR